MRSGCSSRTALFDFLAALISAVPLDHRSLVHSHDQRPYFPSLRSWDDAVRSQRARVSKRLAGQMGLPMVAEFCISDEPRENKCDPCSDLPGWQATPRGENQLQRKRSCDDPCGHSRLGCPPTNRSPKGHRSSSFLIVNPELCPGASVLSQRIVYEVSCDLKGHGFEPCR
jgi:hypothetical protein